MELKDGAPAFYASSAKEWRKWLQTNHLSQKSVWLIIYKKESEKPSVYYSQAVDEALCFGWIDSVPKKRDADSYYQYFAKRNPKSKWSKVNKTKVEKLLGAGKMAPEGLAMIEQAKQTGTWNALNDVDSVIIPADLQQELDTDKTALANWSAFPRSARRGILEWILNAKKTETRAKRITETVQLAAKNKKANHPKQ